MTEPRSGLRGDPVARSTETTIARLNVVRRLLHALRSRWRRRVRPDPLELDATRQETLRQIAAAEYYAKQHPLPRRRRGGSGDEAA
jgi:hypothetical protein